MPRIASQLPAGIRVTDKVTFGQFAKIFPVQAIKQSLSHEEKLSIRERDLPNHIVVYFIMMLALFREASHTEVLRCVFEGLQWLLGPGAVKITGKSGISQARSRVGWKPLKRLFESVAVPLGKQDDKGVFFRGHRIVAIDGSMFDVADTEANDKAFGRASAQGDQICGYPQVRVVGLIECGTHALFGVEMGGYRESEQALAPALLSLLKKGMVCLADRNFMSFKLYEHADKTGAKLVWRINDHVKLPVETRLPDGSYLSRIFWSGDGKRADGKAVRVIEYRVEENAKSIRLVTNWQDHNKAPADELARLYHERWEIENALDEIKTHLSANAVALRSRTPDLVKQEILGLFMGHYAIRAIMHEAAQSVKLDDDELSFTHSVRVVRRRMPMFGNFPPGASLPSDHRGDLTAAGVV